ncbi:MAG: tRNA (adenosine(37)-N6)-threonylcarbamoyltransferase complex ATPase subunit type 1 TsaE [Clostridia bacterium]|nr:tRNA (adenosine(37)-N6)-threonylcarbamoyltransferase complex ATPase subunit type 1 TsaE [Clostridia bacterium]
MKTKKFAFCTLDEAGTEEAGRRLAGTVRGTICLEGELGAGKTVFARGYARGLGITDYITSPTFNIVNVYENDGMILNHMDAYRITDPGMLDDIGFREMLGDGGTTLIEWADLIPGETVGFDAYVRIFHGHGEGRRIIMIEGSPAKINEYTAESI